MRALVRSLSQGGRLIVSGMLMAAIVHAAFVVLFLAAGVTGLALFNVFSCLLYLLMTQLMRQTRWHRLCEVMAGVEVVLHACVASCWLGWDSGFHYYLLLMLPTLMVSTLVPRRAKWAGAAACVLLYLALDLLSHRSPPPQALPDGWLQGLRLFNAAAALSMLAGLSAIYYNLVLRAEAGLREMASLDPLTGLLNRRSLTELARHQLEKLNDASAPLNALSVLLGDVDHFKAVNDQHGHDVGDQVLRAISQALQSGMRQGDLLGRWGGEEFLVLLPGTELPAARMVAERLRALVQARSLRLPEVATLLPVSISFGLCQARAGEPLEQAIARADQALYRAKQAGRNRVALADEVLDTQPPSTLPSEDWG
ncbi:MAG TPA: GGDEF domain-containing protein [Ideonella sp.]|uniref:GGDEF domain-containing protein n=1 Tax=Ideonella sp. TaxID=1929293 RepID=UPI002BAEEAC7|nr:GGDEF domain-containing protein [Ideonella sp.]HSI49925.1 GGDEF domain-containing protein [Ideonella sp.]